MKFDEGGGGLETTSLVSSYLIVEKLNFGIEYYIF